MRQSFIGILTVLMVISFFSCRTIAQKQVRAGVVAFYNLENLYDTINDPSINDEEFLPNALKGWNSAKYNKKLADMAHVISRLGEAEGVAGPAILGICEIENRQVVLDLVAQPVLKPLNYQVVHFDSPDKRGVDVGLIYQPRYFKVTNAKTFPLMIHDENNERIFTRDMLVVSGIFDGDPMHFIVNHWPSRRGGKESKNLRNEAAIRCRLLVDSILAIDAQAKVIVMGDLNDDPVDESVTKFMKASGNLKDVKSGMMYNAMAPFFKSGIGTLAYRGQWNLFDQLLLTPELVNNRTKGYRFLKGRVYNESFLIRDEGQYKGYPLRTYGGNDYLGGYSDHLPVYVVLVKEL